MDVLRVHLNQPWAKQEARGGTFYSTLSSHQLVHTLSWLQCVITLFQYSLCPEPTRLYSCTEPFSSPAVVCSTKRTSSPNCPQSSHHMELGIHWNPLLIRGKMHCKARPQAGSLAIARYYFSWTVPLSADWGRLTAWGRGWRVTERRNDVLWGHRTTTHTPALYPPSSSSDHSEGPLSPFSVLNSWQSHSETCAKEGAGGWGALCYVTVPSLTGAPLS